MGVVVGRGAVDIYVEILTCVFRVKIELPTRHAHSAGQKRQTGDISPESRKLVDLFRFESFTDLGVIGLENRRLGGDVDFGGYAADGQLGVNTNSCAGVDPE